MKIVCLCGSTKFKDEFIAINRQETLKGNIVLSVGLFGHIEGLDMNSDTKVMLDELHLKKIDMADCVFIINKFGYIGESTKKELNYALKKDKEIVFLEKCFCTNCKFDNGYVFECKAKISRPYKYYGWNKEIDNKFFSCNKWELNNG